MFITISLLRRLAITQLYPHSIDENDTEFEEFREYTHVFNIGEYHCV